MTKQAAKQEFDRIFAIPYPDVRELQGDTAQKSSDWLVQIREKKGDIYSQKQLDLRKIEKDLGKDYQSYLDQIHQQHIDFEYQVGERYKELIMRNLEQRAKALPDDESRINLYQNHIDTNWLHHGQFDPTKKSLDQMCRDEIERIRKRKPKGYSAKEKMILLGYLGFFDSAPFGEEKGLGKQRKALAKILGVSEREVRSHYDANNQRFWESEHISVSNHLELFEYLRDEWEVGPLAERK